MIRKILATTLGAGLLVAATSANAALIWQDSFNRANSNTVGNGWYETEDDNDDVRIRSGELRLRDHLPGNPDAAATRYSLDLTGYENISLVFRWRELSASESSDDLYAAIRINATSGAFTNVFQTGLGGNSWKIATVDLGSAADNAYDFDLRFWTDVSISNEGARIDYVRIHGDRITAVAEPATLGLFGLGLAGIGMLARRRRHTS